LNRRFYNDFGKPFSATRERLQPGVQRVLDSLNGDERILDLGCGNGELARALARSGHRGAYLGLDTSLPLLSIAASMPEGFPATFLQADLTSDWRDVIAKPLSSRGRRPACACTCDAGTGAGETGSHGVATTSYPQGERSRETNSREIARVPQGGTPPVAAHEDTYQVVFSFAVLHHIPGQDLRLEVLKTVRGLLAPGGRFILSNWQFLNSARLRGRVQPWEAIGLLESDVDPGDYLLDWRSGGTGLRYVHHFSEAELAALAGSSGFRVVASFYSDGREGNLALYQEWALY
jgi:SAM-dependent methyltransferase